MSTNVISVEEIPAWTSRSSKKRRNDDGKVPQKEVVEERGLRRMRGGLYLEGYAQSVSS